MQGGVIIVRLLKCQKCLISDTPKDEMEVEVIVGEKSTTRKYFHKHCYGAYLKDKAFKEQERVELDKLIAKIMKIYGVKAVPHNVYPFLQDLRNGTRFFGKYDYKYKQGYSYELIEETFEFCSDTIEYYNARKSFNGLTNAIRYGLAIVCDKLSTVEKRKKQQEKNRQQIERHLEKIDVESEEFGTTYKKPTKSKADISDFLD